MYDEKKVAEGLKAFRLSQKKRQEDIANILEINKASVSRWESGENQPTIENLWKLADHFGVTVDALIGRE